MKIALIASNIIKIDSNVVKGTEYFVYLFVSYMVKKGGIDLTIFCSGDSQLPAKIQSINPQASFADPDIGQGAHKIFELALLSKAFEKQNEFDLYHVNIGAGEIILPFAPFVKKPILITIHSNLQKSWSKKYFSLFKDLSNVYFISISKAQQKLIPFLNYYKTIYHGLDINLHRFNEKGGEFIIWSGRGIPVKGADEVIKIAHATKHKAKLFVIPHENYLDWLKKEVIALKEKLFSDNITLNFKVKRVVLFDFFSQAKLFLFPLKWEEPFGLVMIESMACGTPVVAFARGSIPEVIKDGETGFIVNPSDDNIRGNWIIKKTGIEGLCEAVERIYSMPEEEYKQMRRACRAHVEKNFTVERMVSEYEKVYKEVLVKR